ncbi:hypothetical protein DPEC_G00206240 [Dallia pectoralis]|uniref:Uncharacterized protein n=1 Tax=Dallia pectoralis TaxID=75939 RepID=A0ACC2G4U9_DALPE|nr:hypothetical protein DPEC_G00206240 [Dallia pectoralis]
MSSRGQDRTDQTPSDVSQDETPQHRDATDIDRVSVGQGKRKVDDARRGRDGCVTHRSLPLRCPLPTLHNKFTSVKSTSNHLRRTLDPALQMRPPAESKIYLHSSCRRRPSAGQQ